MTVDVTCWWVGGDRRQLRVDTSCGCGGDTWVRTRIRHCFRAVSSVVVVVWFPEGVVES
jgi:hypothetical protein